jgi:hypothetical protein
MNRASSCFSFSFNAYVSRTALDIKMIQKGLFSTFSALLDLFGFITDNNTFAIIKPKKRAQAE